ncbi:hypothetical protein [Roseibium sp.]|uniref:hypothetical protein n=1 Tax=Roseibium sp. TaxID=1936156 RepID=UPI003D0A0C59
MKTVCKSLLAATSLSLLLGTAAYAESGTLRIVNEEPYGAVVTKEAGVLVFRGLPPTRKVIVNPGGKTPLELKQTEVHNTNVTILSDQTDYARLLGAKIIRLK